MYIQDRRSIRPSRFLRFGAWFLLTSLCGLQAQIDTGSIRGIVYDQTMAVIPDVTVTAVDEQRGVERETVSSTVGEYTFTLLEPGTYTLSFAAENFAPLSVEGFELLVGEASTFSPQLSLAAADLEVVILADEARSAIEPERVQQADHIDAVRIQNLPITGRDYLDPALLSPAGGHDYVAESRAFRSPRTPAVSWASVGRGAAIPSDRRLDNYNSVRYSSISRKRAGVQSPKLLSAGRAGSCGTSTSHQSAAMSARSAVRTVRKCRFQARNFFDPGKAPYTRSQSGAGFGGPVERNKTFYYTAYERLDRHESQIVPLLADRSFLTSLTPSQQALADTLLAAGPPLLRPFVSQLSGALTPGNYPHVVQMFEENSGVFPFGEQRQQFLARLDHTLSDGHNIFFRGNWTGQDRENTRFGSLTARSRDKCQFNDFGLALGTPV